MNIIFFFILNFIFISFDWPNLYPISYSHISNYIYAWNCMVNAVKERKTNHKITTKKIKNKPEWSDGKYSYTAGERSRIETRKTIFILNEIIRISCSILYSTKLNENTNWLLAHMSHHFEFILFRFFSCAVLLSSGYIGLYMLAFNGIRYPRLCVSVCLPDEHLIY